MDIFKSDKSITKDFVCNVSNKSLQRRRGLIAHKIFYSEEKPYKCDPCNKTFLLKGNLV